MNLAILKFRTRLIINSKKDSSSKKIREAVKKREGYLYSKNFLPELNKNLKGESAKARSLIMKNPQ